MTIPASSNPVVDGVSECFRVVRTELYVSVAPCHVANPTNGIKAQHLDPLIMTYFPQAQGVVLAYCNITVSKEHHALDSHEQPVTIARVDDSTPFSFMWVSVDLLIWRPQVGDVLQGHVYVQTASHIGLLVHDTFNAAIRFRNIPADWAFVPSQADEHDDTRFRLYGHWTDASGTKIEGKVLFTVRAIHSTGRMVSLEGSLIAPESEADAQPVDEVQHVGETQHVESQHVRFDDEPAVPTDDVVPTYDNHASSSDSESSD